MFQLSKDSRLTGLQNLFFTHTLGYILLLLVFLKWLGFYRKRLVEKNSSYIPPLCTLFQGLVRARIWFCLGACVRAAQVGCVVCGRGQVCVIKSEMYLFKVTISLHFVHFFRV